MTNESLRSISSLPKLEILVMVGCLSVDDVGLQYLEHGCPSLKVLVIKCSIILFWHDMLHKLKQISKSQSACIVILYCPSLCDFECVVGT